MTSKEEIIELIDSKIDKHQYALQNSVTYSDSLSDFQEIRLAINALPNEYNNESYNSAESTM